MIGQTISHYRIVSRLGSGGMGVVYEAQDLTLGRKVALKFLPPELAGNPVSLDRFMIEARAASALNHPNICTIYAVESADGQSFISMELLEGKSMEAMLASGPLPLNRLLDISIQLSDALDAAHAKGIIHRDIKPGNVFVTERGTVKVLDFGLAKLTRGPLGMETLTTLGTPAPHLTSPGSTVGTVAYMSPEQARGEELDARSDLFSLSAVIYQMATGRLAFPGNTQALMFHAILERDPAPLADVNASLPAKLDEIIHKGLEKDRELRYQSAADLRSDLRRLKRDTESGRKASASAISTPAAAPMSVAPSAAGVSQSSALAPPKSKRSGIAILIGALLVVAAGYGIFSLVTPRHAPAFQNFSVSKVTDTGNASLAAISPDAKYILTMVQENGLSSLSLRNVPTNSVTQVEPPADVHYLGLKFAPDGNYFYFVRSDPGNDDLNFLYRAPLLGGTPERLASDVDSNITFSPDSRRIGFMRYDNPEPGKHQLIVRSLDTGEEKVLTSGPNREQMYAPEWSPDGKNILTVVLVPEKSQVAMLLIDAGTGQRKLFFSATESIYYPIWMPDGRGILALVADAATHYQEKQIQYFSYPEGKSRAVTHDTNAYSALSIDSSGRILATVLTEGRWSLEETSLPGGAELKSLASASIYTNFTWLHDGRIVYDKDNSLHWINPETGAQALIATPSGTTAGDPWECPDNQHLTLLYGNGQSNVGIADLSGGTVKELNAGGFDNYPVCSPDGHWVYYLGPEGKLMRVLVSGGEGQKVSDLLVSGWYTISPDGSTVAFTIIDHAAGHQERIVLVDTSTGATRNQIAFQKPRSSGSIQFSCDGKALIYPTRANGTDNLWQQPLDVGPGRLLTAFKNERIWDYHFSPDGKELALVRGHTDSDVVLIKDAQQ